MTNHLARNWRWWAGWTTLALAYGLIFYIAIFVPDW